MDRSVSVELRSAVGPRVIVTGKWDEADIEAELPEGWTIGSNWSNGVQMADGSWSYPLMSATVQCGCGEWSGEPCSWHGPRSETVRVEYMPEHLRSSHDAAGNSGSYPHHGAVRLRVERSCADRMREHDPEWTEIL